MCVDPVGSPVLARYQLTILHTLTLVMPKEPVHSAVEIATLHRLQGCPSGSPPDPPLLLSKRCRWPAHHPQCPASQTPRPETCSSPGSVSPRISRRPRTMARKDLMFPYHILTLLLLEGMDDTGLDLGQPGHSLSHWAS